MASLAQIKTEVAAYLKQDEADFTVNGVDLFLQSANRAIKTAELNHDFEFNRKTVIVPVDGVTGGDLGSAVDSQDNLVEVKTVIEAGILDTSGNLRYVEWTTVAESIERQRVSKRPASGRYLWRTDADEDYPISGSLPRFTFSGDEIQRWPKTEETTTLSYNLCLEVYTFTPELTIDDLHGDELIATGVTTPTTANTYTKAGTYNNLPYYISGAADRIIFYDNDRWWNNDFVNGFYIFAGYFSYVTTSANPNGSYVADGVGYSGTSVVTGYDPEFSFIWATHGYQYLLWSIVVDLNNRFKVFTPRQEGNLPPPTALAVAGLTMLIEWDANKYEQFRRHLR